MTQAEPVAGVEPHEDWLRRCGARERDNPESSRGAGQRDSGSILGSLGWRGAQRPGEHCRRALSLSWVGGEAGSSEDTDAEAVAGGHQAEPVKCFRKVAQVQPQ